MSYKLYIGNYNYSSWSLRPWVLMTQFGLEFETMSVPLLASGNTKGHKPYSDNGLVPCLHEDGFRVWDTLAIAEFLAEKYPGMWPCDTLARARARSISAEMHSGFNALRSEMSMNIRYKLKGAPIPKEVASNIQRIEEIWSGCISEFGRNATGKGAGPYLFGAFSIADAMFAPVCWRFETYNVKLANPIAAAYLKTMLTNSSMKAWETLALAEKEALPSYDSQVFEKYGGNR